jgi:two-component system, NarL family, sensor kinase
VNTIEYTDQDLLIFFLTGTLMFLILSFIVVFMFVFENKKKQEYIKEKRLMNEQFKTEIIKTEMDVREENLKEIARELHDNIGQLVTQMKLHHMKIAKMIPENKAELLNEGEEIVNHIIEEIRRLTTNFNGNDVLINGLESAIAKDVDRLRSVTGIFINLEISENNPLLTHEKNIFAFRMYQEIINNTIKHADATLITIELMPCNSKLCLIISDNGVGFDVKKIQRGSGLSNLEDRCALINAKMKIDSKPGEGTCIAIVI